MESDKLDKRKIIVREIHHWRDSRLLPEQYCDFLLNLYEDHPDQRLHATGSSSSPWFSTQSLLQWSWKRWLLGFVIFSLICFVVLHFKGFPLALQIFTAVTFIGCCYWLGIKIRRKQPSTSLMILGIGSMTMISVGMMLLQWHDADNQFSVVMLIMTCSLTWLLIGIFVKVPLLHFCGWIGLVLLYGVFLTRTMPDAAWYEVEIFWLPLCFVMLWLSWYVHHKNKTGSSVLFLIGAVLWFVPALHEMFFYKELIPMDFIQFVLFVKIVLGAVLLFSLRKKWIAWVV